MLKITSTLLLLKSFLLKISKWTVIGNVFCIQSQQDKYYW